MCRNDISNIIRGVEYIQKFLSKYAKPAVIIFAVIAIGLYIKLAIYHSQKINIRFDSDMYGDQLSYVKEIKKVKLERFRYLGDRHRTPAYNFLQAFFIT